MSLQLHHHVNKQQKNIIDRLMILASVVHPLTAVPQIYSIYNTRNVAGISLWTWLGFMALGLIFLAYGLIHKIKPFILTQFLWFIVDFLVVLGVLLYR